jgi:hypothetical protein
VNFTGVKVEVDIAVGCHTWKAFGNADHFYEGLICRHLFDVCCGLNELDTIIPNLVN